MRAHRDGPGRIFLAGGIRQFREDFVLHARPFEVTRAARRMARRGDSLVGPLVIDRERGSRAKPGGALRCRCSSSTLGCSELGCPFRGPTAGGGVAERTQFCQTFARWGWL